jgi:hypothetical protein
MLSLSPKYSVPANSSRFFRNYSEGVNQALGKIHLVWNQEDEIVVNYEYDVNLIKYDSQYCTSVSAIGHKYSIPTLAYFEQVLQFVKKSPLVIDIGCGQGEFVFKLRSRGIDAFGFDPVVRSISPFLHSKYWETSEKAGDLYVMRCVLPHIQNPWQFLGQIAECNPEALVLIEFQRMEWILEHQIWYQVSHDHVNLFSINDFHKRYKVVDWGTFSNGEWGWVLINPSDSRKTRGGRRVIPETYSESFKELFMGKEAFLSGLTNLDRPIAMWGAAGKGIVLSHACIKLQNQFLAIDADSNRWGHFLEASGVRVFSPSVVANLEKETLILICNPNHFQEVKEFIGDKLEVKIPKEVRLE